MTTTVGWRSHSCASSAGSCCSAQFPANWGWLLASWFTASQSQGSKQHRARVFLFQELETSDWVYIYWKKGSSRFSSFTYLVLSTPLLRARFWERKKKTPNAPIQLGNKWALCVYLLYTWKIKFFVSFPPSCIHIFSAYQPKLRRLLLLDTDLRRPLQLYLLRQDHCTNITLGLYKHTILWVSQKNSSFILHFLGHGFEIHTTVLEAQYTIRNKGGKFHASWSQISHPSFNMWETS